MSDLLFETAIALVRGGNSLFPVGGGQNLLNFRQNFQISDIPPPPPPFALQKTVFSPLLGQYFRKFVVSVKIYHLDQIFYAR